VQETAEAKGGAASSGEAHAARLQRRARLLKTGERLARETAYTVPASPAQRKNALKRKALKGARKRFTHVRVFNVREPRAGRKVAGKAFGRMPKARKVFVATRPLHGRGGTVNPRRREGLLAYEVNGQLVEIRLLSH
jgi:hypothetical protein